MADFQQNFLLSYREIKTHICLCATCQICVTQGHLLLIREAGAVWAAGH